MINLLIGMKAIAYSFLLICLAVSGHCQNNPEYTLLKPDRVFDGEQMQEDWVVLLKGNIIEAAGPMTFKLPDGTKVIQLKGMTLMPGMIEGHGHLFLHPYNETSWNDQVLKETRAERTIRAANHAKATLLAGFTTLRDLGTEGAIYDDVGLKAAIEKGIISGPRLIISTRAIVATGSYGPKLSSDFENPRGAAEADGTEGLTKEIRTQIGKGADFIKLYADYRWGTKKDAQPTFTLEELKTAVEVTKSSGRQVVVHAVTPEAMRRASLAGVSTIEHGDMGTEEVFKLMKEKGVALCPTLAAGESVLKYEGWKKGIDPVPERIAEKQKSFSAALASGVTICMGGDVGVFAHGDNALEMELMVEYGMKPIDVLRSATSVNADVFGFANNIGRIKKGLLADLVAVEGNPANDIKCVRKVKLVIKDGLVVRQ
jgi:imidazolonepropionase-like amidohydrolase